MMREKAIRRLCLITVFIPIVWFREKKRYPKKIKEKSNWDRQKISLAIYANFLATLIVSGVLV